MCAPMHTGVPSYQGMNTGSLGTAPRAPSSSKPCSLHASFPSRVMTRNNSGVKERSQAGEPQGRDLNSFLISPESFLRGLWPELSARVVGSESSS